METFKVIYFSDRNGSTMEVPWVHSMRNAEFAQRFPGIRGLRLDSFSRLVGKSAETGEVVPVTRKILYKGRPSLHECNGKCRGGKCGGKCECRCGGRNHGISHAMA